MRKSLNSHTRLNANIGNVLRKPDMPLPITLDDEYSYPLHMQGSVSTLPASREDDVIEQLHQSVKDVTGKEVEVPAKPRMGFLP